MNHQSLDYLDEVYPEKKLLPVDPFERAQQKMLLEHYSKVLGVKKVREGKSFSKCIELKSLFISGG